MMVIYDNHLLSIIQLVLNINTIYTRILHNMYHVTKLAHQSGLI